MHGHLAAAWTLITDLTQISLDDDLLRVQFKLYGNKLVRLKANGCAGYAIKLHAIFCEESSVTAVTIAGNDELAQNGSPPFGGQLRSLGPAFLSDSSPAFTFGRI